VVARLEPRGGCGQVQPLLLSTFFFFFFVGQGGGSAASTMESQRGELVSRPLLMTVLWSSAPSSGTACSLELSLPSPAGIWFKTLLPVGGANTAELPPLVELVSWQLRGRLLSTSEAGSVGVTNKWSIRRIPTKPAGGLLSGIGVDGLCLRLTE